MNVKGNDFSELTDVKTYIGTKISNCKPMTREVYNDFRGWKVPEDEDGSDAGYIVQYEDGYISWSPEAQFKDAYRETNGMPFGLAIEAMKKGFRVARKGWNGKGIFIELQTPTELSKMTHPYIFIDTTGLQTDNPDAPKNLVPWLASQTDMLSDDWVIL